ncbi:MAG: hypothetical protein EXS37_13265 [Opitutus sp.]|nr:hypothetical protein [Opitutus sp.]
MINRLIAVLLLGSLWLIGGCKTAEVPRDFKMMRARFFLEAVSADGTPVTLPQSGVRITANSKPVLTEGDIVNVELVQVELGKCLYFQLTPTATRDFYRMSVSHQGRRLILVVNDVALGARRLDGVITNGVVFVFAEVPDADLPALVDNLKKTSVAVQREIARKG